MERLMKKSVSSQCRYMLLAAALQREIEQGKYPVGSVLPTEAILCEQFDVCRHTVRDALRQLRQLGLVASRQGSGTVVLAATAATRYAQSLDSFEDFIEFLRQARGKVLNCDMRVMPAELAKACGLPVSQRLWLHIQVLRYWGKSKLPTVLSDAYIDAKYSGVKDTYTCTEPMTQTIEAMYGVATSHFEQMIQAIVLNKAQSQLLKTKLGVPALQTIRCCRAANGDFLVISCNIAPAERYTYTTHMRITSSHS
jgi:GntR family transcriptional regulator